MSHDHPQHEAAAPPFWGSRLSLGLLVFSGIGLFFLLSEHRAHFLGALLLLILLACPVMHLFMHGGHGRHGRSDAQGHLKADAGPNDGGPP